jgi:hypothetical protein
MKAARAAVYTVRHPEEPDEPLPSYVTEVEEGRHGPGFSIDRPEHYLAVLCSSDLADLVIARDLVPRSLSR